MKLAFNDDEQDEGVWGSIDSIQLLHNNGNALPKMYDDWEEAVNNSTLGEGFNLVARQVPAKMHEWSSDELLQALDPKGELRGQANEE